MNWTKFLILIGLLGITIGFGYLEGIQTLEKPFLFLGGLTLIGSFYWSIRYYRDWINPLVLFISSGFIRFGLPSFILFWIDPPIYFPWFLLSRIDWQLGRGLAIIGLISVAVGWLIAPKFPINFVKTMAARVSSCLAMDIRVATIATLSCFLGIILLTIFLMLNYPDPLDAILSGNIRSPDFRVPETSRYAFLSRALFNYGAAILTGYLLLRRQVKWWIGLLPVLFTTLAFSAFGGRIVALAPLAYGLIILWYRKPFRKFSNLKILLVLTVAVVLLTTYAAFIPLYRGGGIEQAREAFTWAGLKKYIQLSLWYEFGMLHPFALGTFLGPGIIKGGTFPLTGQFITEILLGIRGIRPGQFMVEQLSSFKGRMWRFHTGLIVDLYMNVNLITVIAGCILFGIILRSGYEGFYAYRYSPVVLIFYAVFIWHNFWVFYESIVGSLNILIIDFPFVTLTFLLSRILPISLPKVASSNKTYF